jgi:hypothetical protein
MSAEDLKILINDDIKAFCGSSLCAIGHTLALKE